jgi:hypothetical protein
MLKTIIFAREGIVSVGDAREREMVKSLCLSLGGGGAAGAPAGGGGAGVGEGGGGATRAFPF